MELSSGKPIHFPALAEIVAESPRVVAVPEHLTVDAVGGGYRSLQAIAGGCVDDFTSLDVISAMSVSHSNYLLCLSLFCTFIIA